MPQKVFEIIIFIFRSQIAALMTVKQDAEAEKEKLVKLKNPIIYT